MVDLLRGASLVVQPIWQKGEHKRNILFYKEEYILITPMPLPIKIIDDRSQLSDDNIFGRFTLNDISRIGKGTVHGLRLRDSQDSGTPKTPRLLRLWYSQDSRTSRLRDCVVLFIYWKSKQYCNFLCLWKNYWGYLKYIIVLDFFESILFLHM